MLAKKDVQHIAKLARLGLSQRETEALRKDLASILKYVEKLKKVDIKAVEPASHPQIAKNIMRRDEVSKEEKKLLSGFLKVKAIFK